MRFETFFQKMLELNALQKWRKKISFLAKLMDEEVENLGDHGCPKKWEVVDPKATEAM